jgi:glutamate/tyrosine decarboxylase-like PLP-dependent enzyme
LYNLSPVAAYLEEVSLGWLLNLFGFPQDSGGAFVTGAQMANFTCLAAARHAVLQREGWNVELDGLCGAPPVTVVVGDEVHVTVLKALAMLGVGKNRVTVVRTDEQGRIRPDALGSLKGPTIICTQAGNVNSGAFDPIDEICEVGREFGAWIHVDGAFGLWAAVSPERKYLAKGIQRADSWATDAHKWLNVPQDSGIALVRSPENLRAAMAISAHYLNPTDKREPMQWGPESSRRARGIEIWAALRSLGRDGLADLVERTCRHAQFFATGLSEAGFEILNDVVLNQVLVSFGDADRTHEIIRAVQADGTCWCGGTVWRGRTAMRISVASWATTDSDVERSLSVILRLALAE